MSPTTALTLVVVAAVALIVMGETRRLIESSVTPYGEVGSLTAVTGVAALGERDVWTVWQNDPGGSVPAWIVIDTLVDVVFYAAYGAVLLRALRDFVAGRVVVALLGVELVETLMLLTAAADLAEGTVPGLLRGELAAVSTAKWVTVAVLALSLVRDRRWRARAWTRTRLTFTAVKYQRLSALPVVALAMLSTVPGPDIKDQFPDVERGWIDSARGVRHAVAALLTTVTVAVLLFVLGRYRTRRARRTRGEARPPDTDAPLWVWLAGPFVVLVIALLLRAGDVEGSVDWTLVAIFLLVPLLGVVVASRLVACCMNEPPPEPGERNAVLVNEVRRVGDALAIGVVAVMGLGAVRAYAALVVQGADWRAWLMFVIGVVLAVGAFPVGVVLVRRDARRVGGAMRSWVAPGEKGPPPPSKGRRLVRLACVVVAAATLLVTLRWPAGAAGFLGAVALVVAGLAAWVVILGFLVVYLQDHRPPTVFRALRMRAAPVLTLFFLVPAVATLLPGEATLHRLRTLDGAATIDRPDLTEAFDSWMARSDVCDRTVPTREGSVEVRPLLVIAASGGGIRAATWTALALDTLASAGACGQNVALLSSGVSGGSLGLAVSRLTDDPVDGVTRIATSDSLGVGLAGTVVGDLVAGTTGLRVPTSDGATRRWVDRAGWIEREWERQVPALGDPWTAEAKGPTGALVFNSTAVGFGCRVLVSQVDLGPLAGEGAANCRTLSGEPPASLDLFHTYEKCAPRLRWSTAAMLSARFPFVTPAGRVARTADCKRVPDLQLVDGGYAEASGIGTLADIAPQVAALVQAHNANGGTIVVPLVAYLEDATRSDLVVRPSDETPELLVPLVGRGAKAVLGDSAAQLQRVAQAFADVCPTEARDCDAAVRKVRGELPDGVVLVAPSTEPGVSAPLGWALSEASTTQLTEAMGRQRRECVVPKARYAGLCRLLSLVTVAPAAP